MQQETHLYCQSKTSVTFCNYKFEFLSFFCPRCHKFLSKPIFLHFPFFSLKNQTCNLKQIYSVWWYLFLCFDRVCQEIWKGMTFLALCWDSVPVSSEEGTPETPAAWFHTTPEVPKIWGKKSFTKNLTPLSEWTHLILKAESQTHTWKLWEVCEKNEV